jgi:spore maturation protein CgeB
VSLNVVDDYNIPGHNMRTWEIPAAGGVMLSTFTPEQAEFFPEGEAAFYYRSPEEMDAIVSRLKADESLVRRVREAAAQIARANLYEHRVEAMARDLETT